MFLIFLFVSFHKQPLSATNFLYELDKITQEIVTVSIAFGRQDLNQHLFLFSFI